MNAVQNTSRFPLCEGNYWKRDYTYAQSSFPRSRSTQIRYRDVCGTSTVNVSVIMEATCNY